MLVLQLGGFRGSSLIFIATGILLFAFSAVNPATLQGARIAANDIFAPVIAAINKPAQMVSDHISAISGVGQLRAEVAHLREENARLREWHDAALTLKAENGRLSDLLKLKIPEPSGFRAARVISDAGNTFARSVLVLAGEGDGIIKGQAVLSGDGLVGRVIESGTKASRILLLTDINSRVPVIIEGSDTRAILAGQNHPYPTLDHLPPDHKVQSGQRIVTSGHGGLFMPGLPVGQTYVDEQGRVYARLFADLDRLTYVRILDKIVDQAILEGQIRSVSPAR